MKKIQMVDLLSQYQRMHDEIDEAIKNVILTSAFINGPDVKAFSGELAQYLRVKHVIPCANGTDALQIALMALGLKQGDEVITPSHTFIATAEVISLLGLTPVFVDINPDTFNINPSAIEKAITKKTKAILPVHLYGQCADMDALMQIAHQHGLSVVEDTAQAIGAEYRFSDGTTAKAGTIGNIGCTSFFPSKNLGAYGDGGALFTNDDALAEQIRMIANHGSKVKYFHKVVGVNSRLDAIQAAILRVKLKRLDEFALARNRVADFYDAAFRNMEQIDVPYRDSKSTHVFHQYTLKLKGIDRDEMKNVLEEKGIPAMIYYPLPLHLQEAFKNAMFSANDLSVTESMSNSIISLPIHTEMDEEQLTYITSSVVGFIGK